MLKIKKFESFENFVKPCDVAVGRVPSSDPIDLLNHLDLPNNLDLLNRLNHVQSVTAYRYNDHRTLVYHR